MKYENYGYLNFFQCNIVYDCFLIRKKKLFYLLHYFKYFKKDAFAQKMATLMKSNSLPDCSAKKAILIQYFFCCKALVKRYNQKTESRNFYGFSAPLRTHRGHEVVNLFFFSKGHSYIQHIQKLNNLTFFK